MVTRTTKFIKEKYHSINGRINGIIKTRDLKSRVPQYCEYIFNMLLTGIIITYIITHRNFISYGLLSALSMFYIKWFIKTVKSPFNVL